MFGISLHELVIITVVALVVVDPKKIPEVARALGGLIYKWQQTINEFSQAIKTDEDLRRLEREPPASGWKPEPETAAESEDAEKKESPDA